MKPKDMCLITEAELDEFCTYNQTEVDLYRKKFSTSFKAEHMLTWCDRIQRMKSVIQKTKKDSSLSIDEKRAKISRCLEIIRIDKISIESALDYLKYRANEASEMFNKLCKTK